MKIEQLRTALAGNAWLAEGTQRVATDPQAVMTLFPVVARHCGRSPLGDGWSADEAARALLLTAVVLPPVDLAALARRLYTDGDAAERRAVLRALPWLAVGERCVDLLEDALRTNDTRLVGAAMGRYARHLPDHAWRHGVLKCVFMNIPLSTVDGLEERADADLAVMLDGLARERRAADRTLPADAFALLDALT